jgi:peptide deformylase
LLVEFTDELNRTVRAQLSGLTAKAFQHETDHLNGKLIIDYLPPAQKQKLLSQIKDGTFVAHKEKPNDDNVSF